MLKLWPSTVEGSRGRVLGVQHHLSDLILVWDSNSYIDGILYHFLTSWFLKWNIIEIITCNFDWWKGVWGAVICHKKIQQSFLNQSLDPPPPLPPAKKDLVISIGKTCDYNVNQFTAVTLYVIKSESDKFNFTNKKSDNALILTTGLWWVMQLPQQH